MRERTQCARYRCVGRVSVGWLGWQSLRKTGGRRCPKAEGEGVGRRCQEWAVGGDIGDIGGEVDTVPGAGSGEDPGWHVRSRHRSGMEVERGR